MKKNMMIFILITVFAFISGCGSVEKKDEKENANLKLLEESVESRDMAFNEGEEFLKKNEFEKAIGSFRKSTVKDAEFYIAYSLNALGRTEEAKKTFETCIDKGVQAVESLYNLAIIAYDAKDMDSAKAFSEKALGINPDHVATLFFLGNIYFIEQNAAESLKFYTKAAKIDPESTEIQNAIFFVYLQTEQFENAWKMREKIDKDAPETVFAVMQLAEITGNFLEGAKFAKKELLNVPQIRNLAKILFTKGGDLIEAIELAEKEEIAEGKYSVLDRSVAKGSAYILALNSEKNLFVSCETNPSNLLPAEVSEQGIKVEGIEETVPFKDIPAKLSEICGEKLLQKK